MSHDESFIAVMQHRFDSPGSYCLDEPEDALSFSSTLALIATSSGWWTAVAGCRAPCTPRSWPRLLLEIGDLGLRESVWEDLELVGHWRRYLQTPRRPTCATCSRAETPH